MGRSFGRETEYLSEKLSNADHCSVAKTYILLPGLLEATFDKYHKPLIKKL